ncbi:uncharacterized protein BJX67DRAFT_359133 [Aspergillus lucknowensis]|uniref:Uncharacterized protein n=1 Tax=Aspergillus lucknowensis TaxID=176173 RepID=A0ABR4LLA7_9EURO
MYPWKALSTWSPFEIDALGLVTLLGANEVDVSVGRLAPSYWLEYMPLLAGFVFAGDRFRTKQSAFMLYNISSGIVTGNLTAWFTRWMQVQEFHVSRSLVYWEVDETPQSRWMYIFAPALVSATFNSFLLAMTVLSHDWYGFANAIAIILLIIIRAYMLQENRHAINQTVAAAKPLPTTYSGALEAWKEKRKKDPEAPRPLPHSQEWRPEVAKILIVMPDSRAVTMFIPEHILRGVFVTEAPLRSPRVYKVVQWAGWVAFVVHVVTLGMVHLATQLYVVGLIVIPTVLICYGFGCDDSRIERGWRSLRGEQAKPYIYRAGPQLKATVFEWPEDVEFGRDGKGALYRRELAYIPPEKRSTARQDLYAWLDLTGQEQRSLWEWHLLPHVRGHDDSWWNTFNEKQRLIRERPPDVRALKERIQAALTTERPRRRALYWRYRGVEDIEKGVK